MCQFEQASGKIGFKRKMITKPVACSLRRVAINFQIKKYDGIKTRKNFNCR